MAKPDDFEPSTRVIFHDESSPAINDDFSRSRTRTRSCCFNLPCCFFWSSSHHTAPTPLPPSTGSHSSPPFWHRMRVSDAWWLARPVSALKRLREWSELVAGPKWKTFIRRFNRHHGVGYCAGGFIGGGGPAKHVDFQYDSSSYALNFDEGQNRESDEDLGYYYPNFTSRYVSGGSGSYSSKHLMDTGHTASVGVVTPVAAAG